MKYGRWAELLTQKPNLSDHVEVHDILNQDISLFWPQTSVTYSIQNAPNALIKPVQCTCCYLASSYTSASLKPALATHFRKGQNHSPVCHHQGLFLCNLTYLIVVYFTFIFFRSNLIVIQVMLKKFWMCLLELHKFNEKLTHLCSWRILATLLQESCFVLSMKVFQHFLVFPYWEFGSPFEVHGESYEFLK